MQILLGGVSPAAVQHTVDVAPADQSSRAARIFDGVVEIKRVEIKRVERRGGGVRAHCMAYILTQ